jgi:signal transduction histidine kinase
LSNDLKTCVFRIIQEQLTNIIKYADASEVNIKIIQKERMLELSIEDNGKGFDAKAKRNGIGITNIIDRAKTNNGTVTIDAAPGKGCRLTIQFLIPSDKSK